MKIKAILFSLLTLGTATFITSCQTPMKNLTDAQLSVNPSGIYTFSFSRGTMPRHLLADSVKAYIIIQGERYEMTEKPKGSGIYVFDYKIPAGLSEAKFYYELEYSYMQGNIVRTKKKFLMAEGDIPFYTKLVNRYVIQMESSRAPVGAEIAILGRGFSQYDKVYVGETPADTHFNNTSSVTFRVPAVPAGQNYPVTLRTSQGDIVSGMLYIDEAQIKALPSSVEIASGEKQLIVFQIDFPAPESGIYLDIMTDIPESVIMPEFTIPGGARTGSVSLEGGTPGKGHLYVNADGFSELVIPVTIK